MNRPPIMMKKRTQRGVALLEALIAVVLLAIGLIGTVGLQARAQSTLAQADMRAEATLATDKLFGLMANESLAAVDGYSKAEGAAAPLVIDAWYQDLQRRIPDALVTITIEKTFYWSKAEVTIKWTRRKGDPQNLHSAVSYLSAS